MPASIPEAKRRQIQEHLVNLKVGKKSIPVDDRVAPLFQAFLQEAAREGYPIRDIGGYADRDVIQMGKTLVGHPSNHAEGLAIDLNPGQNTQAPRGQAKMDLPYSLIQYAKKLGLKWGGDYKGSTPVDNMHFEWVGDPEKAAVQAAKLGLIEGGGGGGGRMGMNTQLDVVDPRPNEKGPSATDWVKQQLGRDPAGSSAADWVSQQLGRNVSTDVRGTPKPLTDPRRASNVISRMTPTPTPVPKAITDPRRASNILSRYTPAVHADEQGYERGSYPFGAGSGDVGGQTGYETGSTPFFGGSKPDYSQQGYETGSNPFYGGPKPKPTPTEEAYNRVYGTGTTSEDDISIEGEITPNTDAVGVTGDAAIDRILATIRQKETGGGADGYTMPNSQGSQASGAYQIFDSTWKGWANEFGVKEALKYKRAMDAPPALQDKLAALAAAKYLKQAKGNPREVAKAWYIGHVGVADDYFPGGKNSETAGQYADSWMKVYNTAKPTEVRGAGEGKSSVSPSDITVDLGLPKLGSTSDRAAKVYGDVANEKPPTYEGSDYSAGDKIGRVGYSADQATATMTDKTPGLTAMALMYLSNHPVAGQHQGPANIYFNHDTGKFEVEPLSDTDPTIPTPQGARIGGMQPVGTSRPTMINALRRL